MKGEAPTRQLIVEAALRCILKYSIEKSGISSIAAEAGLTRATVYSYFSTKEEVLHAALMQVVSEFVIKLIRHLDRFEGAEARLLEALVYICVEIPKDRYLRVIADPHMAAQLYNKTLTSAEGVAIRLDLLGMIVRGDPAYVGSLEILCEIYTRMVVSVLTMKEQQKKEPQELRIFFGHLVAMSRPDGSRRAPR